MKSLVRKKYLRKRFEDTANFKDLPLESVVVPVDKDGSIVEVVVKQKPKPTEEIPYDAFTAEKNFKMGMISPIGLVDNMTSADKLEYVKQFEQSVDISIDKQFKKDK